MLAKQWRCGLVWVALLALLCPLAQAQVRRFGSAPITVRIEGFVGQKPAGAVTEATWVVRVQGEECTLQVMQLQVLAGNTAYFNIIEALTPYAYAFTVYGDAQALRTLTQAPPNQNIAIIANAQMAQLPGLLFISSIELLAEPTPTTLPTPRGPE